MRRFIDIGANLTDPVFRGVYRGKTHHPDDFENVLSRAEEVGLEKIIVTAGCMDDITEALKLVETNDKLYTTVGVHPTRCEEFDKASSPQAHLDQLKEFINKNKEKVVAIGELGLDYDRIQFCSIETQKKYFEMQLELAKEVKLPLFLHSRNCHADFYEILMKHRDLLHGGVVHSFTGTAAEAKEYVDLDLYIGINGCSLKTADNLKAMASIPSDRLMIETDAPWCGIKNTHAGSQFVETKWEMKKKERWEINKTVKDRCEPCHITQVLEVIAKYRNEDPDELIQTIYNNTHQLFFQ